MRPRLSVTRSAVEMIMAFEGFRPKAARLDDGRWTIGYGHTRTAREGVVISQADAEALLLYDLIQAAHAVNEYVYAPLTQNQFDALSCFVFNIGVRAFRSSPTLRRLNEGRPLDAALAMEMWRKADLEGERIVVDALVRRRAAEKALFLTPTDGFVPAPTPMLQPKLDYDAMALIPLSSPVTTRAAMEGDRLYAERMPEAAPISEPAPSASEVAAAAVIERLGGILAEPSDAPASEPEAGIVATADPEPAPEIAAPPPPPAPEPKPAPVAPPSPTIAETLAAAAPPREPPPAAIPNVTFLAASRVRRPWLGGLGALALGVIGVGLLALAAIWGFQSVAMPVVGVSPHTAGLTVGIIGIVCFGVAAYVMLDRLGMPRDRL